MPAKSFRYIICFVLCGFKLQYVKFKKMLKCKLMLQQNRHQLTKSIHNLICILQCKTFS